MDTNNTIPPLFSPSACLTEEGMRLYLEGKLGGDDRERVNAHLGECEFCAMAMEGMDLLVGEKGAEGVEIFLEGLRSELPGRVIPVNNDAKPLFLLKTRHVFGIAAGLLLLAGLYAVIRVYQPVMHEDVAVLPPPPPAAGEMNKPGPFHEEKATDINSEVLKTKSSDIFTIPAVVSDSIVDLANTDDLSFNKQETEAIITDSDAGMATAELEEKALVADAVVRAVNISEVEKKVSTRRRSREKAAAAGAAVMAKDASGADEQSPVFTVVEEMPSFPGGQDSLQRFLERNLRYPDKAKESGVSGTVYVQFLVDSQGRLKDPVILRGIGSGCEEEVLRVLRLMPPWTPGRQAGREVDVQFTMPVRFSL